MATQSSTVTELAWDHAVQEVPERGLPQHREASADELARIAAALELLGCPALSAEYTITPTLDGRYVVHGRLRAEVRQACVVTLDAVESIIEENFDVTFWPAEQMPASGSGAIAIDDEPEPEPVVAGKIAVGRVIFECLAAAIDPFPRTPGARLDRHASAPEGADLSKPESPFAVLANIKPKG
jgi:hypothetical protein